MKKNIIIALLLLLLFASIAFMLTPQSVYSTIIPTSTSVAVKEQDTYSMKALNWISRFKTVNTVILRVLNHDTVPDSQLSAAGKNMISLQIEVHATLPPAQFITFHRHFSNTVDNYLLALHALNAGNISAANAYLDVALAEYRLANASL